MKSNFTFFHQKKFLTESSIDSLNSKFSEIVTKKLYSSPHDNVIQINIQDLNHEPLLDDLGKKINSFFYNEIKPIKLNLAKLWLISSSSKHTDPSVLPYIPHFDKHRYFKAMIYLHDVTKDHGPLHLGNVSEDVDIESKRNKLPENYKLLGLNTINDNDISGEMIPMLGSAGDIIFFDTNTAHKAGIVTEGYMRRVLRFDFDIDSKKSKPSIIKKFFKKS